MMRQAWIDMTGKLAITRQCELAGVSRATIYAHLKPILIDDSELQMSHLLDKEYTDHPFYGSRRMSVVLSAILGRRINRKCIQRLMRRLGLQGMTPGPNTSSAHPEQAVYPYLLRGMEITRPNQVWSTDITYIRLAKGFVYLAVVIDWYSRKVLSWRINNSMDASFCIDCLEEALRKYGKPDIFNSDQGAQYTSQGHVAVLIREGIKISMDGCGRAFDNIFVERLWRTVKYEDIYLKGYAEVDELLQGLAAYFTFYNSERPHQALQNKTPDVVYATGQGGGAMIVDKYPKTVAPEGVSPACADAAQALLDG